MFLATLGLPLVAAVPAGTATNELEQRSAKELLLRLRPQRGATRPEGLVLAKTRAGRWQSSQHG
jgi:hypothetical protein